jgi:hypothetical protein
MTSFLPSFGSSAKIAQSTQDEESHLEIVVTPSASAFYTGETFSATITFRDTRPRLPTETSRKVRPVHSDAPQLVRQRKIGLNLPENAEAGPSRLQLTPTNEAPDAGFPYSPGANPAFRAPGWPGGGVNEVDIRSPEGWGKYGGVGKVEGGHTRKSRSLALGKGTMSPQEMVWALGGKSPGSCLENLRFVLIMCR